ncbi:hypothetical protein CBL_12652 [Carabus blaptoides fortunei]
MEAGVKKNISLYHTPRQTDTKLEPKSLAIFQNQSFPTVSDSVAVVLQAGYVPDLLVPIQVQGNRGILLRHTYRFAHRLVFIVSYRLGMSVIEYDALRICGNACTKVGGGPLYIHPKAVPPSGNPETFRPFCQSKCRKKICKRSASGKVAQDTCIYYVRQVL